VTWGYWMGDDDPADTPIHGFLGQAVRQSYARWREAQSSARDSYPPLRFDHVCGLCGGRFQSHERTEELPVCLKCRRRYEDVGSVPEDWEPTQQPPPAPSGRARKRQDTPCRDEKWDNLKTVALDVIADGPCAGLAVAVHPSELVMRVRFRNESMRRDLVAVYRRSEKDGRWYHSTTTLAA
jgi:hypothetical protein